MAIAHVRRNPKAFLGGGVLGEAKEFFASDAPRALPS